MIRIGHEFVLYTIVRIIAFSGSGVLRTELEGALTSKDENSRLNAFVSYERGVSNERCKLVGSVQCFIHRDKL
jgi:hypothetical protein